MKNYFKNAALALMATVTFLSACKKSNEREQILGKETAGIYVLGEGSMGSNNSAISYYDLESKTVIKNYYKQVNGKDLGESATDLKAYGSKLYCVVSGIQGEAKSFVDVMDLNTGKTIKRISFNSVTEGYLPRAIAFHGSKAYVSRYDGKISRIDTASLTIDADLQLKNGANNAEALEGLVVSNGNLYVAGSDFNYFYPNSLNDKVVVIDLTTFTKTKEITVNHNPQKLTVSMAGDVFVTSSGNYSTIQPALQKISKTTNEVTGTYNINAGAMAMVNNEAYLATDWGTGLISFDTTTGIAGGNVIKDGTAVTNVYGITVNPYDQSVVVADALAFGSTNGKAMVLGQDGRVKYSFETAATPQHAAFRTKYVYKTL